MRKEGVIIIGAGGHGKVVADALLAQNKYDLIGFADDHQETGKVIWNGYKVICKVSDDEIASFSKYFIVAVGNNQVRKNIFERLSKKLNTVTIIHPFTALAADVKLGSGNVVLAGSVINANVVIGDNCIINSMALIDHDCTIGNHTHVGQAAVIGSGNVIDELFHLGMGEKVISKFH